MDAVGTIAAGGGPGVIAVVGILAARLAPLVWLTPPFGGRFIPPLVRGALVVLLAGVLLPSVAPAAPALVAADALAYGALLLKEVLIGLTLGFVVSLVFHAADAAGLIADAVRAPGFAARATTSASGATLGSLMTLLSIVIFFSLGGHRLLIASLAASYAALPVATIPNAPGFAGVARLVIALSADLFLIAVGLAAPVIATLVIVDLVLAALNRLVPSLPVSFVTMPGRSVAAIAAFALALAAIIEGLPHLLDAGLSSVEAVVSALSAAP